MPKIIFEINYKIDPQDREGYISVIENLKAKLSDSGVEYQVYESRKEPCHFTEMFFCKNEEDFEALEDNMSEEAAQLTQKLFEKYIGSNKVTYSTKVEI